MITFEEACRIVYEAEKDSPMWRGGTFEVDDYGSDGGDVWITSCGFSDDDMLENPDMIHLDADITAVRKDTGELIYLPWREVIEGKYADAPWVGNVPDDIDEPA